jgi:hypothetical protein
MIMSPVNGNNRPDRTDRDKNRGGTDMSNKTVAMLIGSIFLAFLCRADKIIPANKFVATSGAIRKPAK